MSFLSTQPTLIHWQRDACNGMQPSASFHAKIVRAENHVTAYRRRCVFARSWLLGNAAYGYSGTTTLARWRFRSGHAAAAVRIFLIMGRDNAAGTAVSPKVTVTVGSESYDFIYGQSPTASDDAPDDLQLMAVTLTIAPETAYSCSVVSSDYGRVLAACVFEVGEETIDEGTEWFNATIAQAGTELTDAFHGRCLQGLSELHRHNGGSMFHWSLINGAARTRSSGTRINLVDNSTTGAPSSSTPGFRLDLSYRATEATATVAVEVAVYGSIGAGSATVTLVDSSNTTMATVTVNGAAAWYTATATLAASSEKYDLYLAGDGVNSASIYAVSIQEWEA